jgi:DNA-binding Lrp family transcriptional regulator
LEFSQKSHPFVVEICNNYNNEQKLDEKDLAILNFTQKDCRLTAGEIARKIGSPITTVFAKTKRMEKLG